MSVRRSVSFYSEGSRIAADLFLPADFEPDQKRPGIVLCHGFTGVRQLVLPEYAQAFAEAGYASLIFDYRGFGDSEGSKWRLLPFEQVDDVRNAITWLEAQPEVDPQRLGLWGTSYGGAHAPYVAAIDERVKAAVGQVGFEDGGTFLLGVRSDAERAELYRQLEEDRRARVLKGQGNVIDPFERALRNEHSREFMTKALQSHPYMRCTLSWQTWEKTLEYKPIEIVHRIAPRGLLLIAARDDNICPLYGYQRLYEAAGEPKKLVALPITHYQIYSGQWFRESANQAVTWFNRFLRQEEK
jgi:uncharacterized protein